MGKFKFRLATLLRLREATRDERRAELAQAYRADEIILFDEVDTVSGAGNQVAYALVQRLFAERPRATPHSTADRDETIVLPDGTVRDPEAEQPPGEFAAGERKSATPTVPSPSRSDGHPGHEPHAESMSRKSPISTSPLPLLSPRHSHSSGVPLPLASGLSALAMSHSSGVPLLLQSLLVPASKSHESGMPFSWG